VFHRLSRRLNNAMGQCPVVCPSREGVFCGMRHVESCERVICGKCNADFFCEMKGKVRNESMRNVTEMNICKILVLALNYRHIKVCRIYVTCRDMRAFKKKDVKRLQPEVLSGLLQDVYTTRSSRRSVATATVTAADMRQGSLSIVRIKHV